MRISKKIILVALVSIIFALVISVITIKFQNPFFGEKNSGGYPTGCFNVTYGLPFPVANEWFGCGDRITLSATYLILDIVFWYLAVMAIFFLFDYIIKKLKNTQPPDNPGSP